MAKYKKFRHPIKWNGMVEDFGKSLLQKPHISHEIPFSL